MKIFIFGDAHTGKYQINEVTQASYDVWSWAESIVKKEKPELIVFLGDRCRNRDPEGVIRDIADKGLVSLTQYANLIIVAGNHDFYFKTGNVNNNYGILKEWKGINVVSNNERVNIDGVNLEFVAHGAKPSGQGDYLFMHDEIQGVMGWIKEGITKESLTGYKKVYSGHIHQRIQEGNITYIGVPYQQGFGDGDVIGGLILDLSTGKEKWIEGFGPKFLTGLTSEVRGHVVRVKTQEEKEIALEKGALWCEVIGEREEEIIDKIADISLKDGWTAWIGEYTLRKGKDDFYKNIGIHIAENCL